MSAQSELQLQESSPASQVRFPQTIPPDELDATLVNDEVEDIPDVVEDAPVVTPPVPVADEVLVIEAALVLPGPEGPALFVDEVVPGAPPSPPSPVSPSSSPSSKTTEPFAQAP